MDMWSPALLKELSSNHSVIIFDNRGAGESTEGTKKFSISQFANDTVGLLDALKIEKGDILGSSMGSFIVQEIALMYPNRIDNVILAPSGCRGKESAPPSPQVIQAVDAITNASLPTQEDIDKNYIYWVST
jgi:pimeloyl-ACP methyl ester carboxylesterase